MADDVEINYLPAHKNLQHSELGGSTIGTAFKCTGSVFLKRKLDRQQKQEKFSERGTFLHEYCAAFLSDFLHKKRHGEDPQTRVSFKVVQDSSDYEIAFNYTNYIWKNVLQEYITGKAYGIETQFYLSKSLNLFGTIDFWCVYKGDKGERIGVIVDLKTGWTTVETRQNTQLGYYAQSLRKYIQSRGKDLDYVVGHIYQSSVDSDDKLFAPYKFTKLKLDKLEKEILKTAHKIYVEKKATFKVGEWCKFCNAKAICVPYAKEIEKISSLKLLDSTPTIKLPEPESRSDEEVAKVVLYAEELTDWINKHKTFAMNRFLNEKPLPLLKMIEKPGRRKLIDDEEVIVRTLVREHKVQEEVLFEKKLKPMTKLEKLAGGKGSIDKLIEPGKPTMLLVSAADPRPEARIGVGLLENKE